MELAAQSNQAAAQALTQLVSQANPSAPKAHSQQPAATDPDSELMTARERSILNLVSRAAGDYHHHDGVEYAVVSSSSGSSGRRPGREFAAARNSYSKCCSRCDFDDDPTPCFDECAHDECQASCRSRKCMKSCKAALPSPCVPQSSCGGAAAGGAVRYEEMLAEGDCKTCGYGKYPEYEYFVIV
jgi:hypothetical protein